MTKENLRDAIGNISEKNIERFLRKDDILKQKVKKQKKSIKEIALRAVAACLCLLIIGGSVFLIHGGYKHSIPSDGTTDIGTTDAITSPDSESYTLFDTEAFRSKYSGGAVNILCWDSTMPEFEISAEESQSGDIVKEAIYKRNSSTEKELGISLIFNQQDDDSGKAASILQYVKTQLAEEKTFDVISLYSRTVGILTMQGLLLPLNYTKEYLNLDNPWYPKSIKEDTSIKGNTYYVAGDVSTNVIYSTYAFIFNKDILSEDSSVGYTADSLYTLVKEQKWTVEEMYKLVGSYWKDLDGDEKKSRSDGFGFRSYNYHMDALCFGVGFDMLVIDNDATKADMLLTLSPDYTGQRAIDFVDYIGKLMTSNTALNDESCAKNFSAGNDISFLSRIRDIEKLTSTEGQNMDYGILPAPKYDTAQPGYRSYVGADCSLWGISSSQADDYDRKAMSAAIIETMGYYSMQYTTTAIFNDLFPNQNVYDNTNDKDNFILIKETSSIGADRIFIRTMSFYIGGEIMGTYAAKGADYGKYTSSLKAHYRQAIEDASKTLFELSKAFPPSDE